MAEKVVVDVEIKDNVKSLKTQLREAQAAVAELSEKFGATSKEAIQAAKRASELKDAIADAKDLTDAFNPDAKFNALTNSIGGVLNGFQAFEGALGLVGVEGEAVQETLLKVQSAMALSEGIQGALEAKDSFVQLGAVVKNAFTNMTTATKAFMATGLGLIIAGLATVIAYWDDIKSAMSGVSDQQEKLNVQSQANVDLQNKKKDALNGQENILKQQGLSEKQILQLKIKQTEQQIKALEVSIQNQEITLKSQIEAEKRNKDILAGIIKFVTYPLQLILKTIDGIGSFLGKDWNLADNLVNWTASLVFDPKEVETEGLKAIAEQKKTLMGLKNELAGYQNAVKDIDKQAAEEKRKLAQEQADKDKAAREKREKEQQEKLLDDLKNKNLTEEELMQLHYDELGKMAEEAEKVKREQMMADAILEGELRTAILNKEVADQEAAEAAKKELIKRNREFALESANTTLSLITELSNQSLSKYQNLNKAILDNDKLTDAEKAKLIEQNDARAKRAFNIQKAANIASAAMATYQSATSAYQSQFLPIPDPSSPIRGAIAAGLAIATGLANVKKIASTNFESSSVPQGSNPPAGTIPSANQPTPANFNIVGNAGANPLAGLNQPIQAYVVSGQVTTAQEMERNTYDYATFG